jgi:hypothetical protein
LRTENEDLISTEFKKLAKIQTYQTYKNSKYGFEFKYPKLRMFGSEFEITEKQGSNSIYGWTDSTIVLLGCDFCQSYEMIIQAWSSRNDFENNCGGYCIPDLKHQTTNYYLTITNNSGLEDIDRVIETFKFIE